MLNSDLSSIDYKAIKYGSMQVDGTLSQQGKRFLSGQFSVSDLKQASDLTGRIRLDQVSFESDSYRRDTEVNKLFSEPVELELIKVLDYQNNTGLLDFKAKLKINGKSEWQTLSAKLIREQESIRVSGVLDLDRELYDLHFTGFAGTFDMAIKRDIAISYRLVFEVKEPMGLDWLEIPEYGMALESENKDEGLLHELNRFFKGLIEN